MLFLRRSYSTICALRPAGVVAQLLVAATLSLSLSGVAVAQRSLGLDVSAWQGNLRQSTWNNIYNLEGREFVFIRSSRGGTTGYYNQSNPNNNGGENTLSQRYDDPYFVQNITRATNAGLLAGAYHFSRPDITASTLNSDGIANSGADEADHFIEMAGAWMRPGYLMPVHDLEAGDGIRSDNDMAQFTIDFSDRVHEVMGIRPAIYTNGNYAAFVIGGASAALRNQVVEDHPILWSAWWPNQSNPDAIPVQTAHPKDSFTQIYGPWDDFPNPTHPWSFWQYASTGRLNSYNNGNSNLDFNVAQGGLDFLKDRLVPALWTTASDGQWTTLTNWNSGQAPIAPVQGPGQVPRVGSLTLPAVRLPAGDDTVILDRAGSDITVTLSTGNHDIRKLVVREALDITGGSLTVNYVPHVESTPYSAQFSAPVSLSGGSLSVHTLQVDATETFSLSGGELTLDTVELNPHPSTPAKMLFAGDVTFNSLDGASAAIVAGAGAGNPGVIDLGGANRTWEVSNGLAPIDLSVEVPIVNGSLTKTGAGVLELDGPSLHDGDTSVLSGFLSLSDPLLSDTADLHLMPGSAIILDYVGTDTVDSLFINGLSAPPGTWGTVGSGADFTSPQFLGTGLLQVTTSDAPVPADFNGDGNVNMQDLAKWQGDFSQNGGSDADADNDSDGADFLAWQFHLTAPADPLAAGQAVPEPPVALLLIAATLLGTPHRRRPC
ncbi:MAG: glycoside hydrolase family 25 protein [Bythopirellula sp.]